jgi:hypothetical protein
MAVRLNVNINDETEAALKEMALKRGTTVTEIVRRAVSVYKYVDEEVLDEGKTMQFVDSEGDIKKVAFMV